MRYQAHFRLIVYVLGLACLVVVAGLSSAWAHDPADKAWYVTISYTRAGEPGFAVMARFRFPGQDNCNRFLENARVDLLKAWALQQPGTTDEKLRCLDAQSAHDVFEALELRQGQQAREHYDLTAMLDWMHSTNPRHGLSTG